jgi:signal transduction histidine kinase
VLESQLAQAQKLESIGRLASGIAHELNTPLQYMKDNVLFVQESLTDLLVGLTGLIDILRQSEGMGYSELLSTVEVCARDLDLDHLQSEVPEAIVQTLEGVMRVSSVVGAMREFSQPSSCKRTVDLRRAIESTIAVARHEYRYVADVSLDLADDLLVSCAPGELNQALLNIVVNAAHAIADKVGNSGERGCISISAHRVRSWAEIRVRDTGTGIAPEIRDKVFDPFFSTKEVGRGTGQGLAIARSVIADRHGGHITFESEMGVGTVFIIRLPLLDYQERLGRADDEHVDE